MKALRRAILSPLSMLILLAALSYCAVKMPGYRILSVAAALAAWLRLNWLGKTYKSYWKPGYWLVGQERIGNPLLFNGMLMSWTMEQIDHPRDYPSLEITVSPHPADSGLWNIRFRNKGWHKIDGVSLSHEAVLKLIAPELKQATVFEGRDPAQLIPAIDTPPILPFLSQTVTRPRIAGHAPSRARVIAHFYVPGELAAGRYSIAANVA